MRCKLSKCTPAFETISNSFVNVASSLAKLTIGEIGKLALLGGTMALLGGLSMFIMAGTKLLVLCDCT